MEDPKLDLAPGVDLLWGLREQPRRGPRPNLSVEQIVDAAIDVATAEGLGTLSMNRVAERLGRTAMSLYRYVRSKDELLQLMIDVAAVKQQPPEVFDDEGWRPGLERWANALVDLYRNNQWVLHVPVGATPPIGPGQLAWLDRGLQCMRRTPLSAELKIGVVMLLLTYIRGEVRFTQEINQAGQDTTEVPLTASYGGMLRQLVKPDRFPSLAELLDTGVFDDAEVDISEQEFMEQVQFGLKMIFDGIERLVTNLGEARGAGPGSLQGRTA